MFLFLVQSTLYLGTLANIPLTCNSSGTECVFFSTGTLRSTDMASIMSGAIDDGLFSATQINEDLFNLDTLNFLTKAITLVAEFIYMSVFGIFHLILFAFGSGAVSSFFAVVAQIIVFYFYGRLIVDIFRPGSRGEV